MAITKSTVGTTYTEIAADVSAVLGVQISGEVAHDSLSAELVVAGSAPAAATVGLLLRQKETINGATLTGFLGATGALYCRAVGNSVVVRVIA